MKKIHILGLFLAAAVSMITYSCRKDELNPIPAPETGVNGLGDFATGSSTAFIFAQPAVDVSIDLQWISIDQKNTVNKMEAYVTFTEDYVDNDGNGRTANHGTKLYKTIDPVPGNRVNTNFTVKQADVYALFSGAQFNYGNGDIAVFDNPAKADRAIEATRFVPGDHFKVTWIFYTTDGRVFDQWSDNVCQALPGSSCEVAWDIICTSDIGGEIDFVQTNMFKGEGAGAGAAYPGEVTGTVTWTDLGDGKYSTTDATFGQFGFAWSDTPVVGTTIVDACNDLSLTGTDQYGDSYTYNIVSIDGAVMNITWSNTYGDGGTVVLTRKDGNAWPPLK